MLPIFTLHSLSPLKIVCKQTIKIALFMMSTKRAQTQKERKS